MGYFAERWGRTRTTHFVGAAFALTLLNGCGFVLSNATYRCTMASRWQTVEDYQQSPTTNTYGYAVWSDAVGNIFTGSKAGNGVPFTQYIRKLAAGGSALSQLEAYNQDASANHRPHLGMAASNGHMYIAGRNTSGTDTWRVRKTTDGGQTWADSDVYTGADLGVNGSMYPQGIYEDPSTGKLFVGGSVTITSFYAFARMSSDRGATWTRSELYQYSSGRNAFILSNFAKDSSGALYWGGCGNLPASTTNYGIIRKSTDQGLTWNTYATMVPTGSVDSICIYGLHFKSDGTLYAVGNLRSTPSNNLHSAVYKITDNGQSYTTLEDFQYASGFNSTFENFGHVSAVDDSGALYYQTAAIDSSNKKHRVVRKSTDWVTWTTSDDFQLASGQESVPGMIIKDALGNILTNGLDADSSGLYHATLRKLACLP